LYLLHVAHSLAACIQKPLTHQPSNRLESIFRLQFGELTNLSAFILSQDLCRCSVLA
jgi:hypothetical protein